MFKNFCKTFVVRIIVLGCYAMSYTGKSMFLTCLSQSVYESVSIPFHILVTSDQKSSSQYVKTSYVCKVYNTIDTGQITTI